VLLSKLLLHLCKKQASVSSPSSHLL